MSSKYWQLDSPLTLLRVLEPSWLPTPGAWASSQSTHPPLTGDSALLRSLTTSTSCPELAWAWACLTFQVFLGVALHPPQRPPQEGSLSSHACLDFIIFIMSFHLLMLNMCEFHARAFNALFFPQHAPVCVVFALCQPGSPQTLPHPAVWRLAPHKRA